MKDSDNTIGKNRDLFIRLKDGDKKAFESIYWKYSAWVYNFVYSILCNKTLAEDLTQTVFLKIWERHADIRPEEKFESYIFTIARHLVYKETEKRLLAERLLQEIMSRDTEKDEQTEQSIQTHSLEEYIESLIQHLPPSRREIYQLSRQSHLSNKEIANKLSISEKTVETQLYRALQFLKKKLSEDSGLLILLSFLFVK